MHLSRARRGSQQRIAAGDRDRHDHACASHHLRAGLARHDARGRVPAAARGRVVDADPRLRARDAPPRQPAVRVDRARPRGSGSGPRTRLQGADRRAAPRPEPQRGRARPRLRLQVRLAPAAGGGRGPARPLRRGGDRAHQAAAPLRCRGLGQHDRGQGQPRGTLARRRPHRRLSRAVARRPPRAQGRNAGGTVPGRLRGRGPDHHRHRQPRQRHAILAGARGGARDAGALPHARQL